MRLYIVEKPSQIKSLKEALQKAGLYNSNVEIKALVGHILALKEFKDLDEDFKKKSWNELVKLNKVPYFPQNPFSISLKKIKNKKVFEDVKQAIERADEIILATDPDNEGVTLGLEVVEKCNALSKVSGMINMGKLDIHTLSKEVRVINKLPFWRMYDAGRSRAIFDMLFGFNATILATEYLNKANNLLNIGAVKLPTIRMVVERDLEFEKHKKKPYYIISAKARAKGQEFEVKFKIKGKDQKDIDEKLKDYIENVIKKYRKFKVTKFEEKQKKEAPPMPYSLTDLQSEANKKFKLTAKKTLEIAQSLYESHKVESYPRTDCNYYSEGEYLDAPKILNSLASVPQYNKFISKLNLNNLLKRKIFDDSKVTAHTGLAPTIEAKLEKLKGLNELEKKIFHLVAVRYIIQFYPDYEYLSISGKGNIEDVEVEFSENLPLKLGWKEVVDTPKETKRNIPSFNIEDEVEILIDTIKVKQEFTKPKPRFTENTLLKAMEKVYRFFDDEKIKEMLKDSGIGTPATRASIIEDLKRPDNSGEPYFKVERGKIISTQKARDLIAKLPDNISSPIVRASFEEKLKLIVDGKYSKEQFYEDTKEFIHKVANEIKEIGQLRELSKQLDLQCPLCKGTILDRGKIYVCENAKYNPKTKQNERCKFFIIKQGKFVTITEDMLKDLLNGKEVATDKLKMKLDLSSPYFIKSEFIKRDDVLIETDKTFRLGDKFVFKNFRGKNITQKQAENLLKGKEVILSRKSKQGKTYKVKCRLGNNGAIDVIDFVN